MYMFLEILTWLALMVALLLCAGFLYQQIATKIDDYRYPAPGKLVDIGGYKLHAICKGEGSPTVILDAGMGCDALTWVAVQEGVSKFTHVCSYDRAGYGWSDESPKVRTSAHIVKELHVLLQAMNQKPPYILVGHSFGGTNMQLYAKTYPDEVYGLVLVDSCYEKQEERQEVVNKKFPKQLGVMQRIITFVLNNRFSRYFGVHRIIDSFAADQLPPTFKDIAGVECAKTATNKYFIVVLHETQNLEESFKQVAKSSQDLGSKPVLVISRGKNGSTNTAMSERDKAKKEVWEACQLDLVALSKNSKHIIAEKSGHMIPFEQPEIIVDAIKEMVEMYKKDAGK